MLPQQELFFETRKHKKTVFHAFIWWITRKNKHCKCFCPTCKFFFRCQEDVENNFIGGRGYERN